MLLIYFKLFIYYYAIKQHIFCGFLKLNSSGHATVTTLRPADGVGTVLHGFVSRLTRTASGRQAAQDGVQTAFGQLQAASGWLLVGPLQLADTLINKLWYYLHYYNIIINRIIVDTTMEFDTELIVFSAELGTRTEENKAGNLSAMPLFITTTVHVCNLIYFRTFLFHLHLSIA